MKIVSPPLKALISPLKALSPPLKALLGIGLAMQLGACLRFEPLIETELLVSPQTGIDRVAVMPFYPKPGLAHTTSRSGLSSWEAATLVTSFVSEALVERGVEAIPVSELESALARRRAPSGADAEAAAVAAARSLGAGALLVGEVARYRERVGGDRGAFSSASVAFDLTLYEAPSGVELWRARFDQTQSDFSSNPLRASHYPGGGTRFLTAAELARWGAGLAAKAMPLGSSQVMRYPRKRVNSIPQVARRSPGGGSVSWITGPNRENHSRGSRFARGFFDPARMRSATSSGMP